MGKKLIITSLLLGFLAAPVFSAETEKVVPLVSDLSSFENLSYVGLQYLVWKEYDMAIEFAGEGINRFSEKRGPFYYIRATAYEAQSQFGAALNDYERYVSLLKTEFSTALSRNQEEESLKMLLEVVGGYYHMFLLSRVVENKNPQALIVEYTEFLKERTREAVARNCTRLAERMSRLELYLSDISEKLEETDDGLLKVYMQGNAIRDLNEKEKQLLKENQQVAVMHLMRIAVAARAFPGRQKPYPEDLAAFFQDKTMASILDERLFAHSRPPRINGYIFDYKSTQDHFSCTARPVIPNKTGAKSFIVTDEGMIVDDANDNGAIDPAERVVVDLTSQ